MQSIAMHIVLLEEEKEEEATLRRTVRRQLRDHSNPLELPEPLFQKLYRVNKAAFTYFLEVLTDALPLNVQSFGIPPIVKLAACLRFFSEGGCQKVVANDYQVGLAQSSVSAVTRNISMKIKQK
ncbi:uncharacterized protein LOC129947710 [Eupeodes corollae]|uniref:uncharacterized protein LOC129947710 n=1 Tax=Eupeodes corollae TaxID=290404 RepID=UPI0024918EA5|nr:uncharacterized protein LOC129947710 [Eupeodes corollae]